MVGMQDDTVCDIMRYNYCNSVRCISKRSGVIVFVSESLWLCWKKNTRASWGGILLPATLAMYGEENITLANRCNSSVQFDNIYEAI